MGHPPDAVWGYTPRQISGFMLFASKRIKREAATKLSLINSGSRGDPKEVKRIIQEWTK